MPDAGSGGAASVWRVPARGLATWKGAAAALACALLLTWPMLLTGGPLLYFDSAAYHSDGALMTDFVVRALADILPSPAPQAGAAASSSGGGGAAGGVPTEGVELRSIAYNVFFYTTAQSAGGLWLTTVLQTALTLWLLLALVPPEMRFNTPILLAGGAFTAALTTLPWFASYAMPDILGAAVVLFYAVAMRRLDDLRPGAVVVMILIGAFAVAAHYGHFPLAAALAGFVLLWRALQRRLTGLSVAVCLLPILLPAAANFATSHVALDKGSIAPKRMPVMLARSLADGPAAWYLNEACPEAGYAMCELFDEMPENLGVFLWSENGLAGATPEQFDRIREEEIPVLLAALRAYPVAQVKSLLGNAMLQTVSVGTGQLFPPTAVDETGRLRTRLAESDPVIAVFDRVTPIATALAALALCIAVIRMPTARPWLETVAVIAVALLVNAAIFGGLSAPVDRYQSRIVWLIPVVLLLIVASRPGPAEQSADNAARKTGDADAAAS